MGDHEVDVIDLERDNTCIVNFSTGAKKIAPIACETVEQLQNQIISLFGLKSKTEIQKIFDVNDREVTKDSQVSTCESFFFNPSSNENKTDKNAGTSKNEDKNTPKMTSFSKIAKVLPIHPHGLLIF